jgi:hypothetical protein
MIHINIRHFTLSSQYHLVFRREAETTILAVAMAIATAVVAVLKGAGDADAVLAVATATLTVVAVVEAMTVAEAVVPILPVPAEEKTSMVLFATCGEPQNQNYVVSTANSKWFVLRNLARPMLWCG